MGDATLDTFPAGAPVVGALTAAAQVELWVAPLLTEERTPLVPLALLLSLSLIGRVSFPLAVLALNLAGWVLIDGLIVERTGAESGDPVILGVVLGIAIYSVGAHTRPGVPAAGGLALVAAMVALGTLSEAQSDLGDVIFFSVVFGGIWLAGPSDPSPEAARGRARARARREGAVGRRGGARADRA